MNDSATVDEDGSEAANPETKSGERFSIGRLNSFSDAVFAVAITLLVLSIASFDIPGKVTETEVLKGLGGVWPHFFAYALSFVIVGAFWISHHRLFESFRVINQLLLWINLLYLMVIVFIPYPTGLLAKYGETITVTVLYAGCMCLVGLMQALMCSYGARYQRAQGVPIDNLVVKDYLLGSLTMSGVFFLSIGIAFLNTNVAQYSWLLLVPMGMVERKRKSGMGKRPAKGEGQ